jgi:ATP-binding protein involved in chromosome partitioning
VVTSNPGAVQSFRAQARAALEPLSGGRKIEKLIGRANIATEGMRGVRHVVLVGSGKGGVGKSSVVVNLAAALQVQGQRAGIMDADICGPSLPTMLGVTALPQVLPDEYRLPVEAHGLATQSLGYLIDRRDTVDWLGNLASGTLPAANSEELLGRSQFLDHRSVAGPGRYPAHAGSKSEKR